jgi:hypothetical protein
VLHPFPLRAVERQLLAVHRKEVLPEEFAQRREQPPEPPDHRIVAPDRIRLLAAVHDEDDYRDQRRHPITSQKASAIASRYQVIGMVLPRFPASTRLLSGRHVHAQSIHITADLNGNGNIAAA